MISSRDTCPEMNFWGATLCDCSLGAGDTICMLQVCFLPFSCLPLQLSLSLSIPSSERMGWGRKCWVQREDSVSCPSLNKSFRGGWDWMKLLCVNFYNRLLTVLLFSLFSVLSVFLPSILCAPFPVVIWPVIWWTHPCSTQNLSLISTPFRWWRGRGEFSWVPGGHPEDPWIECKI